MEQRSVLVVGGTGKTGARVVTRLRSRGIPVRIASRAGEPPFDWTDPGTWDAALTGVGAVYVVPFDGEQLTRPFVARAQDLGVQRVVLLSGRGIDVPGYGDLDSALAQTHIDGERAVRALGIEWTILRPAWFAQNFSEGFFREAVLAGDLRLSAGDGAATFVDAQDIADVAVTALTEGGHDGRTYELSGPRALTMADVAAEITAATGRELRYTPLQPQELHAELLAQGWSPTDATDFVDTVGAIRRGLDAHLSDGVQRALGREPRDFTAFARAAAASGAWA
jgi:uncharacterized protein YbjT (DUF2867 family)